MEFGMVARGWLRESCRDRTLASARARVKVRGMPDIRTPRLRLRPGTPAALHAELESPQALGAALGIAVASGWPPELYDADAVRYTLRWLAAHPGEEAWSFYYLIEEGGTPLVIGAG